MGEVLAKHTGVMLDRAGRVPVEPDLTIPGHPEIFVIGDLAHYAHQDGKPLPGGGSHAVRSLCRRAYQPEATGERPATVSLSRQREPGDHWAPCWRRRFRSPAFAWFPGMDTVVVCAHRLFDWLR